MPVRQARTLALQSPSTTDLKLKRPVSGCGVTLAYESWALEATVQFCPPRPNARRQKAVSRMQLSLLPSAYCLLPTAFCFPAPVAQLEGCDAALDRAIDFLCLFLTPEIQSAVAVPTSRDSAGALQNAEVM